MTITLTDGGTTLALSDDLRWADEAEWARVEQSVERSITGALIVQVADRTEAGRPITLDPPDEQSAWMPRSTLTQLLAWAAVPGKQLTLSLRGSTRTVMFRHQDAPVIQQTPVFFFSDAADTDQHLITVKLMQL